MLLTKKMNLVHYGSDKYEPEKFSKISDHYFVKPQGGLWTSPVKSKFGWKEWCLAEDFRVASLLKKFSMRFCGNVFVINCMSDLNDLTWQLFPSSAYLSYPLWEPLVKQGVDAVHLTLSGERTTRFGDVSKSLYGWDCETVLIMNSKCINVC